MQIFHSLSDPALVDRLRAGDVGVLATDTLYGLVARVANPEAVERLYALKHREQKPGTTIAASIEQLAELGIDKNLLDQLRPYWPAPLSVVLPTGFALEYLHQGVGTSPFRVVADENVRMLLEQTGPLVTSSANQPGEPPARNLQEARSYFGDHVDFYVDGGDVGDRPPSTIARLDADGLHVLRAGAANITEGKL
ncbi:MAG: L-threonylcarbamoyladenylate synthase [Candidatus Saccharibacteria bacterium]